MPRHPVRRSMVLAIAVCSVLAACGGDDGDATGPTTLGTGLVSDTTVAVAEVTDEPASTETTDGPTSTDGPTTTEGQVPDVAVPPEQLNEAYARGYTEVCNEVWSVSDNGMVYDPEDPEFGYGIDECLDYLDDSWGEIEDSLDEAYDAGRAEAELMVESLTFSGLLCNQSLYRCWEVP